MSRAADMASRIENATSGPEPAGRTLTGWKAIAVHFDKGVRTVQRWEEELALPVRRIKTGRGDTIYAFVTELEAWRLAHAGEVDVEPPAPATPAASARRATAGRLRWLGVAGLSVLCVAIVLAIRGAGTSQAGHDATATNVRNEGPARWDVDVDTLRVFDVRGRLLWSHRFDSQPADDAFADGGPARHQPRVRIVDLDGDGAREVMVAFTPREPRYGGSTIIVLDQRGTVRFEHRPDRSVRFGDRLYSPPWQILDVFAIGDGSGRTSLFAAWVHSQSGEFPCLLERISPAGEVESEYWSAGYVSHVARLEVGGRPSILVGSANNDQRGASLAVFDADRVQGSAPAKTWDKTCVGCPEGRPRAFFVFPGMEFKRLVGGFPFVFDVRVQATGELRVFVDQSFDPEWPAATANVHYDFDSALTPVRADLADNYAATHRRLEAAGLLDHAFTDGEARRAWPVVTWRASTQSWAALGSR